MLDWTAPETYRAVIEQLHEAVIVVDRDGVIRIWSPGAQALFGHSATEMLGAGLEPIVPEHLWQPHDAGFKHAVSTGRTKYGGRVMTTRAVHKSGAKLYVDLSFVLLRDAAGEVFGVCAVGRDCTERHEAARAAAGKAQARP